MARRNSIRIWFFALAALALSAVAITHQSLWIDEGNTAAKALQPSFQTWWTAFLHERGSDLQMPGYMFFVWAWEKLFGASEIALRAVNIPFFVGGVGTLAWGMGPRRLLQTATVLLALTNAFLWYYLSEARPYIFLFGFAAVTAACLFRLLNAPEESLGSALWFRLFCAGVVGLCLASLIAVPWALGAMAAAVYWSGPRAATRVAVGCKATSALTVAALGALGIYYLWTLQLGARASEVGRTGWSNIAFIFYELLGLAGLGPGRLELREQGAGALTPFLPWVAVAAIAALTLLVAGAWAMRARLTNRYILFFLLAVAAPSALVLIAGVAGHMRLVGRHLTPLLPYLLAWMGAGLAALLSGESWKKALAAGLVVVFLISALEIRLAPRHQRDDYRTVATIAREALDSGGRIWWLADLSTGRYYHLPFDSPQVVTSPQLPSPKEPPTMVILSKPDIYDSSGAVRAYLTAEGFRVARVLPAFQIWTRSTVR
ncbi:MAG: hypothetical protein ACREIF_12960 [Chthoniobacterales bacterium]